MKVLGLQLEQLAGQVVAGAVAGRGVVQLARVLAQVLEQPLAVGHRHALRVHHDDLRHAGDHADGHEVGLDVVVELRVHRRRDRVVHRAHEQRVAVGCGARGHAGADRAAGAALVVDDELPAQVLGQHRGQRPREGIGAAAGREGHDQGHRLGRPGALCQRQRAGQGQRGGQQQRAARRGGVRRLHAVSGRCGWGSTSRCARRASAPLHPA